MTAIAFLNGHIDHLATDFDLTVVCNFDGSETGISKSATLININIARPISLLADAIAIWRLYLFLRQQKFDIVHSVSPKAGMVVAISAWLARTPIRVHWFTGQVWSLSKGLKRWLLKNIDKLVAKLDTQVLVDSPSQRDFLINEKVISPSASHVIGSGSIAGVDSAKFKPDTDMRARVRDELNIKTPNACIIVYIGRLSKDKGIDSLVESYMRLANFTDVYLLLVGPDEAGLLPSLRLKLGEHASSFRYVSETPYPERYLAASDIFCMPSRREGFGLSLIEASAAELPIVAHRIYGVIDAVEDRKSGLLSEPNDIDALTEHLRYLIADQNARRLMGTYGRMRVVEKWSKSWFEDELKLFYQNQIAGSK